MLSRSAMALVTALLMFPQIAETIYSPALTDISAHFSVSAADAAQTLAVYFIGFAVGVLFWGWFSDRRGRRPALLLGLAVYTAGCMLALAAPDFSVLLAARIVAAFGAAIGSVVGQTVLRDAFDGRRLAALFSFVGMALAISPAIGVYLGGVPRNERRLRRTGVAGGGAVAAVRGDHAGNPAAANGGSGALAVNAAHAGGCENPFCGGAGGGIEYRFVQLLQPGTFPFCPPGAGCADLWL